MIKRLLTTIFILYASIALAASDEFGFTPVEDIDELGYTPIEDIDEAGFVEVSTVVFDFEETFEASEYDNPSCGTAPCVTDRAGGDGDTLTSGVTATMVGTYCLGLDGSAGTKVEIDFTHTASGSADYVWYKFLWACDDAIDSGEETILEVRTATAVHSRLRAETDGSFTPYADTYSDSTATGVWSADTSIWIKLRVTESTGSNGQLCMWYYAAGWQGPTCSPADGSDTGDILEMKAKNTQNGAGVEYQYWDNVQVYVGTSDPFTAAP